MNKGMDLKKLQAIQESIIECDRVLEVNVTREEYEDLLERIEVLEAKQK